MPIYVITFMSFHGYKRDAGKKVFYIDSMSVLNGLFKEAERNGGEWPYA